MFAPVLDDDEEEEFHHHVPQHVGGGRLAFGTMIARLVKINNILLLLSLGVATFIQFSTLEPRYVNALMWGEEHQQRPQRQEHFNTTVHDALERSFHEYQEAPWTAPAPSTTELILRSVQSLSAIWILTFLRTIASTRQPRQQEDQDDDHSMIEIVLADMLFHIQCRLVIGFLACFTTPWIPFEMMEAAVVCVSVSMQITKQAVLR
jgi:hypothetical protein